MTQTAQRTLSTPTAVTSRTAAEQFIATEDAPQLQQLRAGIRRLQLIAEGLDNDLARLSRCVTNAAEVLGWEHAALGPLQDEITRLEAERERLIDDLDALKAAERTLRAQLLATTAQVS